MNPVQSIKENAFQSYKKKWIVSCFLSTKTCFNRHFNKYYIRVRFAFCSWTSVLCYSLLYNKLVIPHFAYDRSYTGILSDSIMSFFAEKCSQHIISLNLKTNTNNTNFTNRWFIHSWDLSYSCSSFLYYCCPDYFTPSSSHRRFIPSLAPHWKCLKFCLPTPIDGSGSMRYTGAEGRT